MPSTATTRGRTRSTRPTSRSAPSRSSPAVSSSARALARRTRLEIPIPRATRAVFGPRRSSGRRRRPAAGCRRGAGPARSGCQGCRSGCRVAAVRRPGLIPDEAAGPCPRPSQVGHLGVAERLELCPGEPHGTSLAPDSGCGCRWPGLPSEDGRRRPRSGKVTWPSLALSLSSAARCCACCSGHRPPSTGSSTTFLPGLRRRPRPRRRAARPAGRSRRSPAASAGSATAVLRRPPGPLVGEDRGVPPRLRAGARSRAAVALDIQDRPARHSTSAPTATPSACASSTCSPAAGLVLRRAA